MDRNGQEGYYRNYKGEFWIVKDELKIVGEVLNSSTTMLERYKEDIGDKNNFSELSKMFFHLVTTVGNVMPWPKNFNPVTGNKLDIFQEKFPMYLRLYEWMRMVGKLDEDWEYWIKGFVDNHYLQDFVNDKKTEALIFYDEDIEVSIRWNLYFYRASKAIMKRSYRILKEIDGDFSPKQKKEFNEKFQEFCEECNVMEELVGLIKKLDKNDDTDNEGGKPEILELDELIKKLDNLIEQL